MRVPQFARYKHWMSGFALFVVGMVCGSAVFMSVQQSNFSRIAIENESLHADLEQAQADILSLSGLRNKQLLVSQIKIMIESADDDLDALAEHALRKAVYNDMQVAVGKPLSAVKAAPQVFIELIDGQTYEGIRDKNYRIKVTSLIVIQSELTVWITARETIQPTGG